MTSTTNPPLSASSPGSKRGSKTSSNQSLNHLLNFSLPPRQTQLPRRSTRRANGNSAFGVRSTERFVNAQYRFVMKPSGDYTVHFADPDIFFQWHDILQVIVPRMSTVILAGESRRDEEGLTSCPICLSPPTAPRMTKCGHVFCFPCILHYLSMSDVGKWIRCPICFDSVNEKQLKNVKWFGTHELEEPGQETNLPEYELNMSTSSFKGPRMLQMRLMQRPQITTLALPRSPTWPSELMPPHQAPFHFLPDVFTFSKFMLATPAYLIADLTRDLEDLQAERRILESMQDALGISFLDAAEHKIRLQIDEAGAMDTKFLERAMEKAQRDLADIYHRQAKLQETSQNLETGQLQEETPMELLSLNSAGTPSVTFAAGNTRTPKSRRNVNPPPPSTSSYYYYQAAAGSPIFLHPLDTRILLSHFNNYVSFPDNINVKVEAFSEGSVNHDLRKRCKYLALPEGADVVFVEADLESVVGADGLKNFEGALKTRRGKRKEKGRKDDRAKVRAEEKEKERIYGDTSQWNFGMPIKTPDVWSASRVEVESEAPAEVQRQQAQTGAWGSRSFASALHASPAGQTPPRSQRREDEAQDEWDVDIAWHELEQHRGGRKKGRNQRMIILGGGSGGARRR